MPHFIRIAIGSYLLLAAATVFAAQSCETVVGRLASLEGQVEVQSSGVSAWQAATLNQSLCQGDTVRAGTRSRATVALINQAVLRIDQNTAMRLDNISGVTEERSVLSLLKGAFQSFSRKPRGFEVSTPYLNGSIEGTEFVFRVVEDESILTVFEGTVLASNAQGSASVSSGQSVAAKAGQAPQPRTVVRPRDAAQWSLYYPPILATGNGQGVSPALRQAADDLAVGRVSEARSGVEQVIAAGGVDAGLAYALRAVISVVQNEREPALADARQGVSMSPDSAAAKIALSYAQQANFQIREARDTLLTAVAQQPNDALAHARLAELQLMLGDRKQASESARQAVKLDSNLGRTQITLGFAALADFRNSDATAAFEKAIALDSADPLPHLGLGLARISQGEMEQGRADIEMAVGLGSNDALLRAYLGKAYFEEKRSPLDSRQFEIARQLDPNDPTAWLYGGIAKQTQNRPVEAALDLEKSRALNDNRAVYRGRLLLDKDRAARGTSIARAYKDLGLEQLGINEASNSLTIDPANASAHRYLSDTYRGERRREFSRLSELYQAQMLQDINVNPVQPSISAGNLNIVTLGGPATPGFNEFTPLFQQNEVQADVSIAGGNNGTGAGEAVVTVLRDRMSFSLGALKYQTDGFRDNNDQDHDIFNAYMQASITPGLNLQAEYTYRDTNNGDLEQNFDPNDFNTLLNRDYDENTVRLGARLTPNLATTVLLSLIYSDREEVEDEGLNVNTLPCFILPPTWPFPCVGTFTTTDQQVFTGDRETLQGEGQYIYQADRLNVTAGALYADNNNSGALVSTATTSFPLPPSIVTVDLGNNTDISGLYAYGNLSMQDDMEWTIGLSYIDYEIDFDDQVIADEEFDRFNPKLGLRWNLTDSLDLRAAWFRSVMPLLANKRLLEPTQVAGFSQFYDEASGTRADTYAAGLDLRVSERFHLGGESVRRELETPSTFFDSVNNLGFIVFEDRDEWRHSLYAYWLPHDRWSLSAEAVYDRFESANSIVNVNLPTKAKTWSVPLKASYFHPSGFFGLLGVTYIDQEIERQALASEATGDDNFVVTDLAVGYRLLKRRGILSFAVQNLFDEDFNYQDDSYRTFEDDPTIGPYIPERTVMLRMTLNF